jgi:hypothetical protein
MEMSMRSRLTTAALTVVVLALALVPVAWGPLALGTHIPATGQVPANCVEFQANSTGSQSPPSFPGVTITLNSWSNELHTVSFTVSGLASGQYVDISVKSGTTVQEPGPYGNGTHSFANGLQQAISHIRLCVFTGTTTTTEVEDTTTTAPGETTTTAPGETTTTAPDETTTTAPGETTTTAPGETTTTAPGETTTTVAGETTTTVAGETTTSTVDDQVLPTVVTTSTVADEVEGTEVVADDLPFTGFDAGRWGQLALALFALGTGVLVFARSARRVRARIHTDD